MKKPSKHEVMGYIAEMADQLAALCRRLDKPLSVVLEGVAQLARDRQRQTVTR